MISKGEKTMNNLDLDNMIKKEQVRVMKLKEKRAEIDEKIKKAENNITKYTLMQDQNRYKTLTNVLEKKGVSLDDILLAFQQGDLLTLQEKIEERDIGEKLNE